MVMFQRDHLETLLAAVDEGTFDAAATRLRITPSAVSQRVRAMEQLVGRVLLRRSTPITPTADGEVVLRHARQVRLLDAETSLALGAPEPADADADADADDRTGGPRPVPSVPLAVNADSLATWFLDALAVVRLGTDVVFDLYREDQERTASLLRAGTVMGAVTATREPVQGCSSVPLGVMRYRAVAAPEVAATILQGDARRTARAAAAAPGDAPTTLPAASLDRLAAATLVDYDRDDDLQQGFVRSVLGHEPRGPRHHVPTSADFARAILLGFGWGLLPDEQCLPHLAAGTLVELAPGRTSDVALHWQRWNLASPLLDRISDAVVTTAGQRLADR